MMVSHSQLQSYKHDYPKVCMTGVLGCRWHRYKQSKKGSNKKDLICFSLFLLTAIFVIFWFYAILVIKNDQFSLDAYMYDQFRRWISWYTIVLAVICVIFSYIIILLILSLCHIIQGHQLYIHPVHLVVITLILAICVALTVVIEDLWAEEFDVVYISLQMFGPFIQMGAVCVMTILSWTISKEWNRISKLSWRVTCFLMYICVMIGLYISPVFIDCPCLIRGENLPEKPRLVGHRGAMSMAPENTVISFNKAVAYKIVAGLETDVMISAGGLDGSSGTLFVMHDGTLERTTNIADMYPDLVSSNPSYLNISQLRNLDAGSWFLKDDPFGTVSSISVEDKQLFRREQIPLFSEILQIAKNRSKFLMFDLFKPPPDHKHYNDTVTHMIDTIQESGIDPPLIFWVGTNEPEIQAKNYTMIYGGPQDTNFLIENNYTGVNLINGAASTKLLREYKKNNISTILYLVNSAWLYSYYWCLGVTYTSTDYIQDLDQLAAPIWHLAPKQYKAIWITADVISAIIVAAIFIFHRYRLQKNKYGPEQVSLNSTSTTNSWGRRHSRRSMKEKLIMKNVPSNIYDFEPDEDIGISSNGYDATITLEDGRVLAQAFQRNRASYLSNVSDGTSVTDTHDTNRNSYVGESPSENGDTYHSNRGSCHDNMAQTEEENS